MTFIKNKTAYVVKRNLVDGDYFPLTNSEYGVQNIEHLQTVSAELGDLRDYLIAGLSPETGGTLKIAEIVLESSETAIEDAVNAVDPAYEVQRYEVVIFDLNGAKFILNKANITFGDGETPLTSDDFTLLNKSVSIGDGEAVFNGYNADGEAEFNSIKSSGNDVSSAGGNITIDPKAATSVGASGISVYDGLSAGKIHQLRKITSTGNDVTLDSQMVRVEPKQGTNLGDEAEIYKGLNSGTKLHEFRTLATDNLEITTVGNTVKINTPADPSDVKFYVNANYTPPVGVTPNGSLSKPYVTLKDALDAYIGSGTVDTPEYENVGSIELLSDVQTGQVGDDDEIVYLVANGLYIKGNGYIITYRGEQDYFVSTAYLISEIGYDGNSRLNKNAIMTFENVTLKSTKTHKMVYHKNYTSPTYSNSQNTSVMIFTNCIIEDSAYLNELADYTAISGATVFGSQIYYQSSLPTDSYVVKTENLNWTNEGNLVFDNVWVKGSSSTAIYIKNSKCFWKDIRIDFNQYYVNSIGLTGGKYPPLTDVVSILIEGSTISENYLRIENFKTQVQYGSYGSQQAGGQDAVIRAKNNSYVEIFNGFVYSETVNNGFQISKDTNLVLLNFDARNLSSLDSTHGLFSLIGTVPSSHTLAVVSGSSVKDVKFTDGDFEFIELYADSANVNTAIFTSLNDYANNAAALAGGLIPNNVYYNTSTHVATKVIP